METTLPCPPSVRDVVSTTKPFVGFSLNSVQNFFFYKNLSRMLEFRENRLGDNRILHKDVNFIFGCNIHISRSI
jgi:hypothetical protein